MNCLIKTRPYTSDISQILSGKNSYFSHKYVFYTTDLPFNYCIFQETTLENKQLL